MGMDEKTIGALLAALGFSMATGGIKGGGGKKSPQGGEPSRPARPAAGAPGTALPTGAQEPQVAPQAGQVPGLPPGIANMIGGGRGLPIGRGRG
jgi:hypothetical protein